MRLLGTATLVLLAFSPRQDANSWLESARQKNRNNDRQGAIEDATRAIALDPAFMLAYNERGHAKHALRDYAGAAGDYSKAIALAPADPGLYMNRGNVRRGQGDYRGAIEDYGRNIRLDLNHQPALFERAYCQLMSDDPNAALLDYSYAIAFKSTAELHWERACASMALGLWREAIADLLRGIELGASGDDNQLRLWACRAMIGDREEADRAFAAYVRERKPPQKSGWMDAVLAFMTAKVAERDVLAASGTPEDPSFPTIYLHVGFRRMADGDEWGGLELFVKGAQATKAGFSRSILRGLLAGRRGLYHLDDELSFNVLDSVAFNAATGQLSLVGHSNERFHTSIPYLQHLAELLDQSEPKLSLGWTPATETALQVLFRRFDSKDEVRRLAAEWGRVLDENGLATRAGRHFLPLWGVKPVKQGAATGYLGVTSEVVEGTRLRITLVAPGSPASRSGLQPGDVIESIGDTQPFHPKELVRLLKFAGAGAELKITYLRNGKTATARATLGASTEDLWAHVDRFDVVQQLLLAVEWKEASYIIRAMGVWSRLKSFPKPIQDRAMRDVIGNCMGWQNFFAMQEKVQAKQLSLEQGIRIASEGICDGMDRHFSLEGRPVRRAYDAAIASGQPPSQAVDVGIAEMNRQLEGVLQRAFDAIWKRIEVVRIPPALLEEVLGVAPEVHPVFGDVDPGSPLASVLLRADYLAKNLFDLPELKARIPKYKTEFEFEREHPDKADDSRDTSNHHLWISVDGVTASQSKEGGTLEIRDAKLRINIRRKGADGQDRPRIVGGYGDLLTSLYDELAAVYPVFHELREAAKLALVARWIRERRPDFRLPKGGRTAWTPPSKLPARVFLTWSPQRKEGAVAASLMAVGGVTLALPPGAIPRDEAVVELGTGAAVVVPQGYSNAALAKVMRRKIVVPDWRPPGWVATASKGDRSVAVLNVLAVAPGTDPEAALRTRQKLDAARHHAEMLAEVERAINVITSQNPGRQAEFEALGKGLEASRDLFVESALNIVTQRLLQAHDVLRKRSDLKLGMVGEVADELRYAQDALDTVESRFRKIERDLKIVGGNREEAIASLTSLAKDLLEKTDPRALGPLAHVMIPVRRTLGAAGKLEDVFAMGSSLVELERARRRLKELDLKTDTEGPALRDKLLPLQRKLSDQLDRLMRDPDLKKLTGD